MFCEAAVNAKAVGCVIVKFLVVVQPFASVTVQVQTPIVKPVTETVPSPVGFPGVQLYVYGPVPPVAALTLAAPFEPPLQDTFVCEADVNAKAVGCVTVKFCEVVHPFASVTVHVQVPAVKPVTETVPSPVGLPGVQL